MLLKGRHGNLLFGVSVRSSASGRHSPQRFEGRRQVRKNVLEEAEGSELRERRREPLGAGDEIVGQVEPLQVRASKTLERGDGVEIEVDLHQIDQGLEASQVPQRVVGEGENLHRQAGG